MTNEAGKYYPAQMNGAVITAFANARDKQFALAEHIINHLYNLSIDTANEIELENIGRIVGYSRPLVPEGFNAENILLLGSIPMETDEDSGLSNGSFSMGGHFTSDAYSETGFMEAGLYRRFLKAIAFIKRYGITLKTIDKIASAASSEYTINFDANNDIVLHFKKSIGYKNVWVLTQLFYSTMTEPQVLITSGGKN